MSARPRDYGLISLSLVSTLRCRPRQSGVSSMLHFVAFVVALAPLRVNALCPTGKYSNDGTMNCEECPSGTYSPMEGANSCVEVPAGYYTPESGYNHLINCPGDTFSVAGSSACDRCIRSFYLSTIDGTCRKCPDGTLCNIDGNSTEEKLTLHSGYWRISAESEVVLKCPLRDACTGGVIFENSGDSYCAQGYTGPLCAVCDIGYFYETSTLACLNCAGRSSPEGIMSALVCGFVVILLGCLCIFKRSRFFQAMEFSLQASIGSESGAVRKRMLEQLEYFVEGASEAATVDPFDLIVTYEQSVEAPETSTTTVNVTPVSKVTVVTRKCVESKVSVTVKPMTSISALKSFIKKLRVPLRTIVGFWQISAFLSQNCGVAFPKTFGTVLSALSIFNFDVFSPMEISCSWDEWDYISQLFAITAAPIAISLLGLLTYACLALMMRDSGTQEGQTRRHLYANAFLLLTFFVYVSSSRKLLQYFRCERFDGGANGPEFYLSVDYSIDCDDSRYKQTIPYVLIMLLSYPIGIPCLYGCLVWQQREILCDQESLELEAAYGYPNIGGILCIVEAYSTQYYWFECAECLRRLSLGAILGLASRQSTVVPSVGLLISLTYLCVSTSYSIYRDPEGSMLGIVLSYSLTIQFLAAQLIRIDAVELENDTLGIILLIVFFSPIAFLSFHLVKALAITYPSYFRFCSRLARNSFFTPVSSIEMKARVRSARGKSAGSDESSLVISSDELNDDDMGDTSGDEEAKDDMDDSSEDDSLFGKSSFSSSATSTKSSSSVKSEVSLDKSDGSSVSGDHVDAALESEDGKSSSSVRISSSEEEEDDDDDDSIRVTPEVGKLYGIELRSAYNSSGYDPAQSSYFLDAHRSTKQDKLTSKATCVLVHDSTGVKLMAHDETAGHWLIEALNSDDLATLPKDAVGTDYFRLKLLSGHRFCPQNNYLCGVTSESVTKLRKLEAKVFSRNGESTWCFVQSLENCFEPVSSIWTLEPVFGSSNHWKIRLVTERNSDVEGYIPSTSEHYLEAHRSELSDMRDEVSSSVNVHMAGALCKSEWRFHEIDMNDSSYQESSNQKKAENRRPSFQRVKSVRRSISPVPPPSSLANLAAKSECPRRTNSLERFLEDSEESLALPKYETQGSSVSTGAESSLGQSSQASSFGGSTSSARKSRGASGVSSRASSSYGDESSPMRSLRDVSVDRSNGSGSEHEGESQRIPSVSLVRKSSLDRGLSEVSSPASHDRNKALSASRRGPPSRRSPSKTAKESSSVEDLAGRGKKSGVPTRAAPARRRNSPKVVSGSEKI